MLAEKPIQLIHHYSQFPDTGQAIENPNGLLAVSEQLNSDWLLASYRKGIFPWYSIGEPVLWWTPNPRAVLYTREFKLHRSLRKAIGKCARNAQQRITLNHVFEQVMRGCAAPREDGLSTWITEDIIASYTDLHRRGFAHSVEHWIGDQLMGGLYCVAIGNMVFGESMFSQQTDASKIAFAYFVAWLKQQGVRIIDCQQSTRHLRSLGAVAVSREHFETELAAELTGHGPNWRPQVLEWSHDAT